MDSLTTLIEKIENLSRNLLRRIEANTARFSDIFLAFYDSLYEAIVVSEFSHKVDYDNDYDCLLFNDASISVYYDSDYECLIVRIED